MDFYGTSDAESEPYSSKESIISHIVKHYGKFTAVDDVSFTIKEGEIFGIIGPNGAGKTTTVECISGLRETDSGSISIFGYSPEKDRKKIKEFVGVQLQESTIPPRMRVGEALELFASIYPSPMDLDQLLEMLGIAYIRNSLYKTLSGGQKQRLSVALALIGNPRVAILDELTTGLDPEARRETWGLIEDIRKRGVTVILVTHFMDEAQRLCDRLALITNGKIVALDTPEAVAAGSGVKRVTFIPSDPVSDEVLLAISGVRNIERKEKYISVSGTGDLASSVVNTLSGMHIGVSGLEASGGNLDDAFVQIAKENKSEGRGDNPHGIRRQ